MQKRELLQEKFFDEFSKRFKNKDLSILDFPSRLEIERFIKFISLPIGSKLLEVGCGAGRYVIPLLKLGYHVTVVDISKDSLNLLKLNAEKINLTENLTIIRGDFKLIINSSNRFINYFDGAYAINLLHHVENKEVQFRNIVKSDDANVFSYCH